MGTCPPAGCRQVPSALVVRSGLQTGTHALGQGNPGQHPGPKDGTDSPGRVKKRGPRLLGGLFGKERTDHRMICNCWAFTQLLVVMVTM